MSNIVWEQIHQVLVNLVRTYNINRTYVDKDDQISLIVTATAFVLFFTVNSLRDCSLGQFEFGRDVIITIKYTLDK